MKKWVKKEKKKYPYHRVKNSLFNQISDVEKKKKESKYKYAIVDKKGKVIEKFMYWATAHEMIRKIRKNYYEELEIVSIDDEGNVLTT